jgi:thiamine kinase-like enzyme
MRRALEPVMAPDAVDADWLTGILTRAGVLDSGRVVSVRREPCGTGQLADSYRFTLRYDPSNAGPATIVGKFASQDATSREVGRSTGYYLSEIRFYTDLAPGLGMEIPVPIHAALAPNATDFVLLMEDLSPARSVDQLLGCTADEAALVVERAATLHARSWRNHALAQVDWLQSTTAVLADVTDNFAHTVESFPRLYGDLVAAPDLAEAAKLIQHAQAWKRVFSDPQCLWHSDLRVDNVLFDARGGVRPAVLLDWQGVGFGRGTIDLAYFLATSLTTTDRRAYEQDLVKHYHQALVGHGVTGYDLQECWEDYRVHAVHSLQIGVFGLGAVKRTPRGDEMWRVWIERSAAHTRDLDSFAALATR